MTVKCFVFLSFCIYVTVVLVDIFTFFYYSVLNVAAKGRVVELLADELARTEIIRALLVEYGKECVENVTLLEKHCLDCMMDRCNNR